MTVIACIDDNNGMLFGGKRQSRDSKVLEDIQRSFSPVVILPFSEKMIGASGVDYILKDTVDKVRDDETVFLENVDLKTIENRISRLIIYKWNRKYLSDFKFNLDLGKYERKSVCDFSGSSHDKITREVYEK
ncbi:MAG: ribonuclease Z [Clostridia bacterium]|nr:ribonuclease Z [Clostridia bacterium]